LLKSEARRANDQGSIMPTKPKPKKKRREPRPFVEVTKATRELVTEAINAVLGELTLGPADPTPRGKAIRLAARRGALAAVKRLLPADGRRPVGKPPEVKLEHFGKFIILERMARLIYGGTESEFEHGEEPQGYVAPVRPRMGVAKAATNVVAEQETKRKAWLKDRRDALAMKGTPPTWLSRGEWRASFVGKTPPGVPTKGALIAMWRTRRRQAES
jgi:hypothetical protein